MRAGAREAHLLERGTATRSSSTVTRSCDRSASLVAPVELAEAFGLTDTRPPHGAAAALVARAAARLAEDPAGDDLRRLEPIYLRAPRGIGP